MIMFLFQNGGPIETKGNNWPLRGGKHGVFEGGTRVPAQRALYVQCMYIVRTLYQLYVQCTYIVRTVPAGSPCLGTNAQKKGIHKLKVCQQLNMPSWQIQLIFHL